MQALEAYERKSAPGHAELLRKFGPGREDEDRQLRRLVVTLDLTLTNLDKPAAYRANQARLFLAFNHERIAALFGYARVITCDALPRENAAGAFENTMRVWVLEEDVDKAATLIAKQKWVAKVEPEAAHTVHALDDTPVRSSGVTHRPAQAPAPLSL